MKIVEFMFGSALMFVGYILLDLEVLINKSILLASEMQIYNSTSIEYTNLILTNTNGILLAFIIFVGGAYAVAISLPSVLAELYSHILIWYRNRTRDTL